ncbi:MAG: alpha/beta hydrolase [bacterium]
MANNQKTIIILPGWGGTKAGWQGFMELFKEDDLKVICFNLPCFGDEPCPKEAWGVEEYADFVKKKIIGLKISGPVVLFGHSFGGQVAAYLAAKESSMFTRLILSGPAVIRPNRSFKRFVFVKLARLGKILIALPVIRNYGKLSRKVLYRLAGSPDYSKTSGIEREIYQKIIRQDLTDLLPKIKIPALIIWGSKDSYVPLRNGRKIVSMMPKARLKIIKGGKHGLHLQQPKNLYKIVKEFLD